MTCTLESKTLKLTTNADLENVSSLVETLDVLGTPGSTKDTVVLAGDRLEKDKDKDPNSEDITSVVVI